MADNEFYRFLRSVGSEFLHADGSGQAIRTTDRQLELIIQECHSTKDRLIEHYKVVSADTEIRDYHIDEPFSDQIKPDEYLHQHDFFELMFVLDGSVDVTIEDQVSTYYAGDACLINRSVRHLENYIDCYWSAAYLGISANIASAIVKDLSDRPFAERICAFLQDKRDASGRLQKQYLEFRKQSRLPWEEESAALRILKEMVHELTVRYPGYSQMIYAYTLRLFCVLSDYQYYQFRDYHLDYSMQDYILEQTKAYLDCQNQSLNRRDLEQKLHYNANYISRVIKEKTGMTLTAFAQVRRLKRAASLLAETELSVNQICTELGFENKTHFYRLFQQKYCLTPNAYRKAHRDTGTGIHEKGPSM